MKTASKDFVIENNTLKKYKGQAEAVEIPEGIESIGGQAFSYNPYIESVTMPDSVRIIRGSSFDYCPKLKSVKFSANLERIGNNAFLGCDSLEDVIIPRSVKSVGEKAFALCRNLKSVTLPDGEILNKDVFEGYVPEIRIVRGNEPYPVFVPKKAKISDKSLKMVNQIKELNQQLGDAQELLDGKNKRIEELNSELAKNQKSFDDAAAEYNQQIAKLEAMAAELQKKLEGYEVLKNTLNGILD